MALKRFAALWAILFAMAFPLAGETSDPYFCDKENAVLQYTRTTVDGDVKWYHTMRIGQIVSDTDSVRIEYTSHILNHRGKPYYGDVPAELVAVIKGGTVILNVAESVAAVFRTIFSKNTHIASTGGESSLPVDMAPGDTLPDVYSSVKALGMTMKINVTERQVLRYERISTPAGEFDCIVVRERKLEKGMGRNRHTVADTWYARGVGMVRHDTHDKNLKLQTSEILTEMTF